MNEMSTNKTTPINPDFAPEEYEQRRQRAAAMMRSRGIDALFLNSEANHRYFTGHSSGRWLNRTRPIFLIITKDGAATILCSRVERDLALMSASGCEMKMFGGSGHDLDPALKVLAEQFQTLGLGKARIGAELGIHHRPQIPPLAFEWLRAALPEMTLVDGSDLLWRVRGTKSAGEIVYHKAAVDITHRMYEKVPEWLGRAKSEREAFHHIGLDLLTLGGEQIGYRNVSDISMPFGGGYTDRPIRSNRVIYIDAGCSVAGYWSDFVRIFALGVPGPDEEDTYKRLWDITSAGIDAVRPGMTINELYSAIRRATEQATGGELPMLGRVGHSIGLEIVEPPSICSEQQWVLEPGMVLCIEPSLTTPSGGTLIAEETVVVRENGAEMLTKRAPERLARI